LFMPRFRSEEFARQNYRMFNVDGEAAAGVRFLTK
jgi:hypothetical protein